MTTVDDRALEVFASMLEEAAAANHVVKEKAPTSVQRQAAHKKAMVVCDIDHLLAMQDKMKASIDRMTANVFLQPEELTQEKLTELMEELLDQKDIEKLLKARYDMIREMIFNAITVAHEARGVADPVHAPGAIPVTKLGKKFTREGGKLKSFLSEDLLREKLGTKRWNKVHKAEIVPAVPEHIEYHLDHDALLELVAKDPSVMEIFRQCVVPQGYTNSSFWVRDLDKDD